MADSKLKPEALRPEHREFLKSRARDRGTTLERELERVIDLAISLNAPDTHYVTYNPSTGAVCLTPKEPTSIMDFAGTMVDPGTQGKDVDELLYGEETDL
ncbi:MAG: hypothetical protein R6V07_03320 [Armatimonadota bacterium]